MKNYLENTLRQKVDIKENIALYKKLPLVFKSRYKIYDVKTNNISWVGIRVRDNSGLINLRKDRILIEKVTNLNCALFLRNTTFYIKEKLIKEGIPFVIDDKEIYLPFIGTLLTSKTKKIKPVKLISYITQKMILMAIYEKWKNVTAAQAARILNISRMTATRCFDEIEYLNIDILDTYGKSKVITILDDKKALWNNIANILRNPVIKKYEISNDLKLKNKAGISALSKYSLIDDNRYPTYALTKKELSKYNLKEQADTFGDIGCVVLELGYYIDFNNQNNQDPLSAILSLDEEEKADIRVSKAIEEVLKEILC